MSFPKKILPLLVGLLLIGSTAFAQKNKQQKKTGDVTNKELKEFSHVAKKAQQINMQLKQQAQKEINESNLSQQRYSQIAMSKMNPKADTLNLSSQEESEYQKLHGKLTSLQKQMQSELKTEVKKEGLTWQRFQKIAMALRQDKDLQQRFRKIRMQQMKSDSSGNG